MKGKRTQETSSKVDIKRICTRKRLFQTPTKEDIEMDGCVWNTDNFSIIPVGYEQFVESQQDKVKLIGAEEYRGRIYIHIREYVKVNELLIATKCGVNMDTDIWEDFKRAVSEFKYYEEYEICNIGGKLVMSTMMGERISDVILQNVCKNNTNILQLARQHLRLSREEFCTMSQKLPIVSKTVLKLQMENAFKNAILQTLPEVGSTEVCTERLSVSLKTFIADEVEQHLNLYREIQIRAAYIESELLSTMTIREQLHSLRNSCDECQENNLASSQHDCEFYGGVEKYFDICLNSIIMNNPAEKFANKYFELSRDYVLEFMRKIDIFELICECYNELIL